MTAPINPVPLGNTAQYMRPEALAIYQDFSNVPLAIRGLDTTVIHIAPNGNVTHLSGPNAGQEGVWAGQNIQGEQQLPFEQVILKSAFLMGATIQRTNYDERMINLRVLIVGRNNYEYQIVDNRWWDGQDETRDAWLGIYSRFSGWRWIPVRPFKTVDTTQRMDPVAYGNNVAQWDITWIAARGWYSKPAVFDTWSAVGSSANKDGYFTGVVVLANQGDMPGYVQYLISGAGIAQVQDNNSDKMVKLPELLESDGPGLCDTDPEQRTLTAANDSFDDDFFKLQQSAGILNFFLTNKRNAGKRWWQRGYTRFLYSVPPLTTMQFNVAHTNPNASITVMLTQRFKRSR
jgi:hypothetical protein